MCVYFAIALFYKLAYGKMFLADYTSYGMSEYLVNYQAGFIRRGLLGEMLYSLCKSTNIMPDRVVLVVCALSMFFVIGFLFYQFRKSRVYWWLIPVIVIPIEFIRKDFLLICIIFGMLYVYRSRINGYARLAFLTLGSVFIVLAHEAEFFMFFPLLWLVIYYDRSLNVRLWSKILMLAVVLASMLVVLKYTGQKGIGWSIQESWSALYPDKFGDKLGETLSVMDWGLKDSLIANESFFFLNHPDVTWAAGIPGAIVRILLITIVPYLVTRYFYVAAKPGAGSVRSGFPCGFNDLCTLIALQMIFLLPMWLGLTSDYGRTLCQMVVITLGFVFIIPDKISGIFPGVVYRVIGKCSRGVDRVIPRSMVTIALIILFFGIPYSWFYPWLIFDYSVVGTLLNPLHLHV